MQPSIAPEEAPEQSVSKESWMMDDGDPNTHDEDISKNLEAHLNSLPDDLKAYLVENLNPVTVNVLGIVNGKEVYDYFQQFIGGQEEQQPTGEASPQPQPQPQPTQQQAAPQNPTPFMGMR